MRVSIGSGPSGRLLIPRRGTRRTGWWRATSGMCHRLRSTTCWTWQRPTHGMLWAISTGRRSRACVRVAHPRWAPARGVGGVSSPCVGPPSPCRLGPSLVPGGQTGPRRCQGRAAGRGPRVRGGRTLDTGGVSGNVIGCDGPTVGGSPAGRLPSSAGGLPSRRGVRGALGPPTGDRGQRPRVTPRSCIVTARRCA